MGKFELPEGHKPAMRVPRGGSSCSVCKYLGKDQQSCVNKYYIQYYGSGKLGAPADEFCSDWFESSGKPRGIPRAI